MKVFTGTVVSISPKTVKVTVDRILAHPLYKKRMRRSKKYLVHDELGAKVGEMVKFTACRPVSKKKKWKVTEIVGGKNG